MAKLQFINAVEYQEKPQYAIETDNFQPGPLGVVFRASGLINQDGSFDVTLVPWANVVSVTHPIHPEDDPSENDATPDV
jgi:hypothetical protein